MPALWYNSDVKTAVSPALPQLGFQPLPRIAVLTPQKRTSAMYKDGDKVVAFLHGVRFDGVISQKPCDQPAKGCQIVRHGETGVGYNVHEDYIMTKMERIV